MGPLTSEVAKHHTAYSACCGLPNRTGSWHSRRGYDGHPFEPIRLASGGVAGPDGYLDLRAAWLCDEHDECAEWCVAVMARIDEAVGPDTVTVGTGTFGAMMLASTGDMPHLLWTPKDHGLPCSPFPPPPPGTKVVLVEDVISTPTGEWCARCHGSKREHDPDRLLGARIMHPYEREETGGTLWRMRRWCKGLGYEIVGEVVASEL